MLRIKGIIYLIVSCWFIWHENSGKRVDTWQYDMTRWSEMQGSEFEMAFTLFFLAIDIASIVFFFKGLSLTFLMGRFTQEEYERTGWADARIDWKSFLSIQAWNEAREAGPKNSQNSNIDNIKNYRDSKFANMNNETMASEYRDTAWLDALESNNTPNAQKARNYINSKLSIMDNETAYEWLKGNKKS